MTRHAASPGFGARLRAQRERHGITIDAIAGSTKINPSLLVALERDDLSHWPDGIYRRAWLRDYALAIGLAPEVTEELIRTASDAAVPASVAPACVEQPLRLTLASASPSGLTVAPRRILDAAATLAAVVACGALATLFFDVGFWNSSASIALVWYPLSAALFGSSPVGALFRRAIRKAWSFQAGAGNRTRVAPATAAGDTSREVAGDDYQLPRAVAG